MTSILTAALLLIAPQSATTSQPPPPAPIPPAPSPVVAMPYANGDTRRVEQLLVRWTMSPVICRDKGLAAPGLVLAPAPQPSLAWAVPGPWRTMAFDFRIDASGRPLSITRGNVPGFAAESQDVAPALAAARFAPGAERRGCTVTFTSSATTIAAAPVADLFAYSVFPNGAAAPRAVWDRIRPRDSGCIDPLPDVLLRAFPAFKTLPDQPGFRSWSITRFDLDARGKPTHMQTAASSGTPALDAASRAAVGRSRFEPGRRTGCLLPYYKNATLLAAPEPPEEASLRPADATCPLQHEWARPPELRYPAAYGRRRIEGWAIVAYDVAPWGQTGNVRVLRAEPTAEFGDAAAVMIRNAAHRPAGSGYTGCTERVRYVIRKPGGVAAVEPEETGF